MYRVCPDRRMQDGPGSRIEGGRRPLGPRASSACGRSPQSSAGSEHRRELQRVQNCALLALPLHPRSTNGLGRVADPDLVDDGGPEQTRDDRLSGADGRGDRRTVRLISRSLDAFFVPG